MHQNPLSAGALPQTRCGSLQCSADSLTGSGMPPGRIGGVGRSNGLEPFHFSNRSDASGTLIGNCCLFQRIRTFNLVVFPGHSPILLPQPATDIRLGLVSGLGLEIGVVSFCLTSSSQGNVRRGISNQPGLYPPPGPTIQITLPNKN